METTLKIVTETPESAMAIMEIMMEVERAIKKHPEWPNCNIKRAAIVIEEAGELIREANLLDEGKGDLENLRTEAIQVAATAIRMLRALQGDKQMVKAHEDLQVSNNQ